MLANATARQKQKEKQTTENAEKSRKDTESCVQAHILVNFYSQKRGRVLLLRPQSKELVANLNELFVALSRAQAGHTEEICSVEWIQCEAPIRSVALRRLSDEKTEPSKSLRVLSCKDGVHIEWSRHGEGWLECANKIAALRPRSHQYLNRDMDDAVVEVSFMEP